MQIIGINVGLRREYNMNLDKQVIQIMEKELTSEFIENALAEKMKEVVNGAIDNVFKSYGDASKLIEEKIKSVLMPQIESYNYSEHIVKLDSVLTEILSQTTVDNRKLLENFKGYMSQPEKSIIDMTELFKKYIDYLSKNAETDKLEVITDDGAPYYEHFSASYDIEFSEERDWSCFKHATLVLENEKFDDMNFEVRLTQYNDDPWRVDYYHDIRLESLRHKNSFEIFLMNLDQCGVKLNIDEAYDSKDVEVEKEPECTYEFVQV